MNFILRTPIVLVGMMGSGKTTLGSRLAASLNAPFYDTDKEIEKIACCSISDIFYYAGEEYFRKVEKQVIDALLTDSIPKVIASGGGSFIHPEVRKVIKDKALSIWIKASAHVLLERVSRRSDRPLLETGDKRTIIEALTSQRYPIYSEADIIVTSDNHTHIETVKHIITAIQKYNEEDANR
ncbi:MAG: shikimate kinase [Alphaproteobacteria bacterium]|nr:shikimate kinase [Alphaproteobacteria bacterium]OJV12018.1 MAG: hypothetical protein BGO27_00310 [Alphaproteobacteria bacterium 33-17]